MNWWDQLAHKRGSQPRCVSFMHGGRAEVAQRLTNLVNCAGVRVDPDFPWMPTGLPIQKADGSWDVTPAKEAILDLPNPLLSPDESQLLRNWWLRHAKGRGNTPNWDIASTCLVDEQKGLLLIEAKAHGNELEAGGKKLDVEASDKSCENHKQIGQVIADAAASLQRDTKFCCAISRDQRYQMSNRFAMASKLTEMGYAVVLVYLGFLNADEMSDQGKLFHSAASWEGTVEKHSDILFPKEVWGGRWVVNGRPFPPVIRSQGWPFCTDSIT